MELLKDFLYEAIFIPEGVSPPARDIVERPELRLYYEGFGNAPADHCLAAETDGHVVGAVWTRIMNDTGMWTKKLRHLPYLSFRNTGGRESVPG